MMLQWLPARRPLLGSHRHRSLATLHALGDSWTGAWGHGSLEDRVEGHNDEDVPSRPLAIFQHDDLVDWSTGWGHTAVIVKEKNNNENQLYWTGRPHEWSALLRLQRAPGWLRNYALRTQTQQQPSLWNPSTWVDSFLQTAVDQYLSLKPDESVPWNEQSRQHSHMSSFQPLALPESPKKVACSAGLTAILTEQGNVYTVGLNAYGQCGNGTPSRNVWEPHRVALPEPMADVQLGLQHAVALSTQGRLYTWGKGLRGQLGHGTKVPEEPLPVRLDTCVFLNNNTNRPTYQPLPPLQQIDVGFLHACATDGTQAYLWGKHVLEPLPHEGPYEQASDAPLPVVVVAGPVKHVACGSHHTSLWLQNNSVYSMGLLDGRLHHTPVQVLEPGTPIRSLTAHMDRTTVVLESGEVWQLVGTRAIVPGWKEEWNANVKRVERSWLHTLIETDEVPQQLDS